MMPEDSQNSEDPSIEDDSLTRSPEGKDEDLAKNPARYPTPRVIRETAERIVGQLEEERLQHP
ncbi:MAG: hypothetical protein ACFBZ8_07725 [Opitutales bacterium]